MPIESHPKTPPQSQRTSPPAEAAPFDFAIKASLSIAALVLSLIVVGMIQRGESSGRLVQFVGDCLYRDGSCSTAYATWTLVVVSAFALVAAVVAGMYARASSHEAHVLAELTAQTAENMGTLATILEGALGVKVTQCPTPPHSEIIPIKTLWLAAHGELSLNKPAKPCAYAITIFEAKRFDRRNISNFHVKVQAVREHVGEGSELPFSNPINVPLGDIDDEPIHIHIHSAQDIPEIQSVRIVFSDGVSVGIDERGADAMRIPVKVSPHRHSLTIGVVDV